MQIWNETLKTHWDNTGPDTDECTAAGVGIYANYSKTQITAKLLIQKGHPDGNKWDYVVLQGYGTDVEDVCSINGITLTGDFFIYTKKFADEIRKYSAEPILYMRAANNPAMVDLNWYKDCIVNMKANYAAISDFIDAPVVPVGLIQDALSMNPPSGKSTGWLYSDNIHPSDEGLGVQMYAFASVLAQKSYKDIPVGYGKYGGDQYTLIDPTLDSVIRNGVYDEVKDLIGDGGTTVTKPTAPSGLSATALSDSEVDVHFTDNATNETGFDINYRTTGSSTWLNKVYGSSSGTGPVVATVTGLSAETGYEFRVCAKNSAGSSSYTSTATATTLSASNTNGTSSTFECENLSKTSSDTVSTYTDSSASGGKWDYLAANAVDDYVEYTLNVAAAGTYTVKCGYKAKSSRGVCQLKIDGSNQGSTVNQSVGSGWLEADLGSKTLTAGNHTFRFQVTAANSGSYALSCDVIKLTGGGTVDNPPVADADENIELIDSDNNGSEVVTLIGSGSTDDNGIVSYVWTVGSEQIGTGATLEHTFAVGEYDVTLTVTDTAGQTDSDMLAVVISAGSGTGAAISDNFESGGFSGGTGWVASSWSTSGPSWQMPAVTTANVPSAGSGKAAELYRDGAIERTISLSGAKMLTYAYKTVGLDAGEFAVCEVLSGGSWSVKKTYTTNTSGSDSVALTGSETAIRFRCSASRTSELMSVDNVEIK